MIRKILFLLPIVAAIFAPSCKEDEVLKVFSISPQNITFNYEGDSSAVSVYGDEEKWEMWIGEKKEGTTWCSFNKEFTDFYKSGKGPTSEAIKIYSKPNLTRKTLYDTLYLKDLSGSYGTIKVKLKLSPIDIKFSADTVVYLPQAGGEYKLKIQSNVETIDFLNQAEGITASSDIENGYLIFDVEANNSAYTLKKEISVKGSWPADNKSITMNLVFFQDGTTTLHSDSTEIYMLGIQYNLGFDANKPLSTWKYVQLGSVTNSLGFVTRVTGLDLSNRGITAELPTSISQLAYLKVLRLNGNSFSGEIPPAYLQLRNLEALYLGNNPLTGNLPNDFDKLENLKIVSIINTQVTGTIGASMGKLKRLETLELSNNLLTGNLPGELGALKTLTTLTVNGNNLSGKIPASYKNNINWYNWNPAVYIIPQRNGVSLEE